jgi:hypothetical protein
MVNRGWTKFCESLNDAEGLALLSNFNDFIFAQAGAAHAVGAWADTVSTILMSIQQAALFTGDKSAEKTVQRLQQYPCVPADWRQRAALTEPMASFRVQINIEGELMRFFVLALWPAHWGRVRLPPSLSSVLSLSTRKKKCTISVCEVMKY